MQQTEPELIPITGEFVHCIRCAKTFEDEGFGACHDCGGPTEPGEFLGCGCFCCDADYAEAEHALGTWYTEEPGMVLCPSCWEASQ